MEHNVILDNDTTGKIDSASVPCGNLENYIGKKMQAFSHDENGNCIEVEGILTEVLD